MIKVKNHHCQKVNDGKSLRLGGQWGVTGVVLGVAPPREGLSYNYTSSPRENIMACELIQWHVAVSAWDRLSSVWSLSQVWLFVTPWTTACQASLSITSARSLLKLMSIKSVMPSNHLILCRPLLLLPSIFPSIRVFSNKSVLHIRWPKYWNFTFSISPSNEYSGLISFSFDWLDPLAVQGTLKSVFQHNSSKAPMIWHSSFFKVQLSHPYMTTGKTIALTRWTLRWIIWKLNWIEGQWELNVWASGLCLL